ncbi:gliding motility-associated C-terminal domain-containing protein [Pontimicrobium sp. IMCC45349]|uniref:T9SS type B sorting domain-containing protein n=1 Tax=Pontimicrobium sp. IMCC45349 TaxID=3391574 RepID=UPI0039A00CA8
MKKSLYLFITIVSFLSQNSIGQDVTLYQQFNGRYDYTAIGNTLNSLENGPFSLCTINTSSSAILNIPSNQTIVAAYLYWAGSGNGDFDISLNGLNIAAERTFSDALDSERVFFAAFADVTEQIITEGNTTYTISDFDLTSVIEPYCPTGTNFAGWAITIIYQDDNLPLNQVNIYDGLQSVPESLSIELNNLNVLDTTGAKIGFVAWEGDSALAVNEVLTINGNVIGNPPLNPTNNAFNGTNSFTGMSNLYNMDIDVYNIQNNISIGDDSAVIQLTSGQDFVMINNIITVLNSQLPDATITLNDFEIQCNSTEVYIEYTVYNNNATDILPSNTPIAFYVDNILITQSNTLNDIEINGEEFQSITFAIPENFTNNIELTVVIDDDGLGNSTVIEINEDNNFAIENIQLIESEPIITLENLLLCDEGFNSATFDLTTHLDELETEFNISSATFYTTLYDAENTIGEILFPDEFNNTSNPQTIILRTEETPCYQLFEFDISVENCPPHVPQGFSPNDDGYNDWFNIQGLYNIFENHELLIYNRYGTLIFKGNNNLKWDGKANVGLNNQGSIVPVGTYFYVLHLNDPNYKSLTGWVYLNN